MKIIFNYFPKKKSFMDFVVTGNMVFHKYILYVQVYSCIPICHLYKQCIHVRFNCCVKFVSFVTCVL